MNLFETLEKKQRKTPFQASEEMSFFLDHAGMLSDLPYFEPLSKAQDSFSVVRANLVIRALLNKEAIEQSLREARLALGNKGEREARLLFPETVGKTLEGLPYYELEGEKIYIPFLSKSLNRIYSEEFEKLEQMPYKRFVHAYEGVIIDPFDYYGDDLYDSYFTRLLRVKKSRLGSAYYDYDACCIYFVNPQGRLDVKLCLFDRYLKEPNRNHMMGRILPVVDAFEEGNRKAMEKALVDNKLISSRLIYKVNYDEVVTFGKIERKVSK